MMQRAIFIQLAEKRRTGIEASGKNLDDILMQTPESNTDVVIENLLKQFLTPANVTGYYRLETAEERREFITKMYKEKPENLVQKMGNRIIEILTHTAPLKKAK